MRVTILKWLAVGLLAALAVYLVVQGYEAWRGAVWAEGETAGAARVHQDWADDRAQAQAAKLERQRLDGIETARRLQAQERNQREQNKLLAHLRRDADDARAAVDGLQLRAATYLNAAGCDGRAGDSAIECIRQAAAQVGVALGRCAARHQQLAADADDARARGLKCEADYDALTLKATPP